MPIKFTRVMVEDAIHQIKSTNNQFIATNPVNQMKIEEIDEQCGIIRVNFGKCRSVDAQKFGDFLRKELKVRVPEIQYVGYTFSEE